MQAMAQGIYESVDEHIRSRIGQAEYLGELFWAEYPHRTARRRTRHLWTPKNILSIFPKVSFRHKLAANLYVNSGVFHGAGCGLRGARSRDRRSPLSEAPELVRLTIPRRVYTQAHMDVVAEAVLAAYEKREEAVVWRWFGEPEYLRFFQARFRPSPRYRMGWAAQRAGKAFGSIGGPEAPIVPVPRVSMRREE